MKKPSARTKLNLKKLRTQILAKKAQGYEYKETVEEYTSEEGSLVLNKRKVSTKYQPPDLNALKALEEVEKKPKSALEKMSDEELIKKRDSLLLLLKENK